MSRLATRYGFRGTFLIVLGSIWCAFGLSLLLDPEVTTPGALHQYIPLPLRTLLWCATGVFSVVVGLRGKGGDDSAGHVALMLMPLIRMLSYLGAWITWLFGQTAALLGFDVDHIGTERGFYPALLWLLIVTMLRVVAAWPNPTELPMPPSAKARR